MAQSALTPRMNAIEELQDPTQMSDALATKLGYKQYSESGADFTISGTNWTTDIAIAIPYQLQDGSWRLRFDIRGTTSAGTADLSLTFSGVTFSHEQSVSALANGTSPYLASCQVNDPDSGKLRIYANSSSQTFRADGDVKLASKPTWAV